MVVDVVVVVVVVVEMMIEEKYDDYNCSHLEDGEKNSNWNHLDRDPTRMNVSMGTISTSFKRDCFR